MKIFSIIIIYFLSAVLVQGCNSDNDPEITASFDIVVAQDGSGDYKTVQEAFNAVKFLQDRTVIFVKNGTYKEVITLPKGKINVALIGEAVDEVILTYDNYASKINPETGEEYGTSGSSSTYIHGDGFYARNITFENSAGPVGQALAVYIDGDKAVFENCRFLGNQDTMYGGRSRQYFHNCEITGTTDFIFGPATAFFDNCKLFTNGGSAITAASTEHYVQYGYVFKNCSINGSGSDITTLGRPWRPYAAVVFLETEMSGCIKPLGWDNWGNAANEETARYAEYESTGEGATMEERVDWIDILSASEADNYTIQNVFKTTYSDPVEIDNWNPLDVIEEMSAIN